MELPAELTQALGEGWLLLLWGELPYPLAVRPPASRVLALNRLPEAPALTAQWQRVLTSLPTLPILSLDASDRLERAFEAAGVPLQVVRGRTDVPAAGRHSLLKLAGDLPTRTGVVFSRAELRDLRHDPDKRHLLDEARRIVADGALLLLGCDTAAEDFRAWWAALAPVFRGAALFAVGKPPASWPEGVVCLGPDLKAVSAALRAASETEEGVIPMSAMPRSPRIDPGNPPYADLRKLLQAAFEAKALRRLSETPPFQPLRSQFGVNDSLDELIDQVLSFCRTQLLWEELLDAVAGHSPRTYNHFASQLGWPQVPVPESPPVPRPIPEPPQPPVTPPSESLYDDVEIHVGAVADGRYRVRIRTSLTGDGQGSLELPWTEEELRRRLASLERGETDRASLAAMGAQLFRALFQGSVRDRYAEALGKTRAGLRLRLWFEPPELQALPWELLYDEERRKFLGLVGGVLITRYLSVPEGTPPLVVEPPLCILVVTASPLDQGVLDVDAEAASLQEALAPRVEQGLVRVAVLHHARARTLNRALRDQQPHVLHFTGHGHVGPDGGLLLLEDPDGRADPLPGSELATLLTWTDVRLAVLNACLSSRDAAIEADRLADRRRAMLGVGPALVNAGLGAVVANQFSMADAAARLFVEEFYTNLARFDPVDEAVSRARVELMLEYGEGANDWATPVLFLRAPNGVVFARPPGDP